MKAVAVKVNPSKKGKLFQRNSKCCLNIQDAVNKAVLYQSNNLVFMCVLVHCQTTLATRKQQYEHHFEGNVEQIEFCIFALKYSFETC